MRVGGGREGRRKEIRESMSIVSSRCHSKLTERIMSHLSVVCALAFNSLMPSNGLQVNVYGANYYQLNALKWTEFRYTLLTCFLLVCLWTQCVEE